MEDSDMRTVYLVDDDRIVLDKYLARGRLFNENGFEIIGTETNPLKALEEIRITGPDAVFCDLKMPELSGIQLMEELKSSRPLFVIVSAYGDHKEVRKLFLSNGFDYIIKPVSDSDLADLLTRLTGKLDGAPHNNIRQTASAKLNEIMRYLKDYSDMNHTLDTLSQHFGITGKTICNLFSKHLNTTFSSFLNTLRIEHAEKLLRTTQKPVKEIAVCCGYSDPLYFTRVFHKARGVSPTRFREAEHGE
jgi:YesN/AraC family two-component response regulator